MQPGPEELLAATVGAGRVEVADAARVGGVEDLERAGAQRVDGAVRTEVRAVAHVQVSGTAESGEAEAEATGTALAGADGERRPGRHGATLGAPFRHRPMRGRMMRREPR